MSESEAGNRPPPNRRRRSLTIRRNDHIGDSLGSAFLHTPQLEGDAILARIGEYLGAQVKILKADFSAEQIDVDVEARGWPQEGARLAAAAVFSRSGLRPLADMSARIIQKPVREAP